MNLSLARRIAKDPESFSTRELDDALTFIVDCDKLSEKQVSNLQAKIDPTLRKRIKDQGRTFPIGTNVRHIDQFDRSIKVVFGCKEHTQYEYMSKDPFCSQMFPANEAARKLQWGETDECTHTLKDDVWVTTKPYFVRTSVSF